MAVDRRDIMSRSARAEHAADAVRAGPAAVNASADAPEDASGFVVVFERWRLLENIDLIADPGNKTSKSS
jgi:hypothetical protein